jgi:excisionase family DNA binding protein
MYHVTSATVLNWIRAGKLKAYTTPGGHYRVAQEDLERFSQTSPLPPAAGEAGLRILFVGDDAGVFDRVCAAIRSRWPRAHVERAAAEMEIGWQLARLRPTVVLARGDSASGDLLRRCRSLAKEIAVEFRAISLPESQNDDLSQWLAREFGPAWNVDTESRR